MFPALAVQAGFEIFRHVGYQTKERLGSAALVVFHQSSISSGSSGTCGARGLGASLVFKDRSVSASEIAMKISPQLRQRIFFPIMLSGTVPRFRQLAQETTMAMEHRASHLRGWGLGAADP
jgi:hypothetical protein